MITVIDDEFLDEEEREEVKNSCLNLLHLATMMPKLYEKGFSIYMLPLGLYVRQHNYESDIKIKRIMLETFDWLYFKLFEKISDIYGTTCTLNENLNPPGFHIFIDKVDFRITEPNYHVDKFPMIEDLKDKEITSWIVPITLPKKPTGLKFKDGEQFYYKEGMLANWSGNNQHAIWPVIQEEGEYRITLQSHSYINDNGSVTVFW